MLLVCCARLSLESEGLSFARSCFFLEFAMNETDKPFIVVGLDGSAQSIKALEWAVRHAQLLGANVHAIGRGRFPARSGSRPHMLRRTITATLLKPSTTRSLRLSNS